MSINTPFTERQKKLKDILRRSGFNALALNPGPSLYYLSGLYFHLSERPVVAIFTLERPPVIILPELEAQKTKGLEFEIDAVMYGEDPLTWPGIFTDAVAELGLLNDAKIGIEDRRLRVLELRLLENAIPERARILTANEIITELRIIKDNAEIKTMREAVDIAEHALRTTLDIIRPGISEQEVASELTLQLLRNGSQPELPFFPIVSSGANSANPHATPSERVLTPGDMLVIDWGASMRGYISDITRTFAIGYISPEFKNIYRLVLDANTAAQESVQPGSRVELIDKAARDHISKAGYGNFFIHRTGHGIGLEGHEPPYIRQGNQRELFPGMTFTIEPGIYLPEENGVRIEDDILVTDDGGESLTTFSRELTIIE